ncbi:MAG TPA: CoA transferase, partial [Dehalococcoidia bacterium]|nr:CoA transferase [Dehalococcoidia bacterium]
MGQDTVSTEAGPGGPLRNVRVLDLTTERGAYATKLLADLGADVIRVEPPAGDSMRDLPPFLDDERHRDRSLTHWFYNSGKRSIIADLHVESDRDVVRRIAGRVDILVESHDVGSLASLGLGHDDMLAANDRLIYVSITPFGQQGPWRDYRADDFVLCALGGMMGVCGDPDRPPLVAFGWQAYHTAGNFAALSAMAALRSRRSMGRGQYVDVSIEACVAGFLEHVNVFYLHQGSFGALSGDPVARRQGPLHWSLGFRTYRTADGYALLSHFHQWDDLIAWLAADDMAEDLTDPRYDDPRVRRTDVHHVCEVIARWAATKRTEQLVNEGQLRRFPWA